MAIVFPKVGSSPPVSRLANLRDLGGLPARAGSRIRTGMLFRSDSLHRADPADWIVLSGLGVRSLIDLRTPGEADRDPVVVPADVGDVARYHVPVLHRTWFESGLLPNDDAGAFLAARYIAMVEEGADAIGSVLRALAEPTALPAVVFCTVGKDRTGVVVAVVLGLLGVPDEAIVHDYAASDGRAAAEVAVYREAPPEALVPLLAYLRSRYGSMVGYARSIGVPLEVVEGLHERLLV